jgi:hypothetical protein
MAVPRKHQAAARYARSRNAAIAAGYGVKWPARRARRCPRATPETVMDNLKGPNIKKRPKCKNCEGKGLLKKGDKVVKCQRCKGTGVR